MISGEPFERQPEGVELPQVVGGGQRPGGRRSGGNALGRIADLRLEPAVLEERNGEENGSQQAQRRRRQEQDTARGAGLGARPARPHGRFIGQQDVVEQVGEEHPLRHFPAAGGGRREHLPLGLGACAGREDAGGAGGRVVGCLRRGLGRRGNRRALVDNHRAYAREIESAQERPGAQLAGTAQVHQELYGGRPQLAEFARELVGRRKFGRVRFARQEFGAGIGQRAEQALEILRQPGSLLLAVYAFGAPGHHGQRDAEHLAGLFGIQIANVFQAERQAVHPGEEHVDGQVDAEGLRNLAQSGAQVASRRRCGFEGALAGEVLAVEEHHGGPRRLLASRHHRSARLQLLDERAPLPRIRQQAAARLHKEHAAREPQVKGAGRSYVVILIDLARQQFRLDAGMQHHAGLGGAGLPDQQQGG